MTDAATTAARPYSPGLEGVIAGETSLSLVDGERGRLLYRGYRIGDLVAHGTYPAVANLLWTGEWDPRHRLATGPIPPAVMTVLRTLPATDQADGRAADRGLGVGRDAGPAVAADRRAGPRPDRVLAVGARGVRPAARRPGPDRAGPRARPRRGFLYQLNGERPDAATARALDAYFIVGAEHGFNASTFTARVITSTRSDIASAVTAAIGTMKGPLHGGAPSEVVDQLAQVGSPEHAEEWVRGAIARGERLMGFGHRVYRAYDPRAAALRKVAEGMEHRPDWLELAIQVEDVVLRVLAEKHPDRALKTNVEYYAAPVLMGVGLAPDLFPATFSLARHAGWTAHALEQAADNRLIRPDVNYVRPRRSATGILRRLPERP